MTEKKESHKGTTKDYLKFLGLFLLASAISITGMYFHLKYPKMGLMKVLAIAMVFCVVNWYFMAWAISIQTKYELLTPTQDTMLLIIVQWVFLLLLNHFFLDKKTTRSDMIAFPILLFAFAISGLHLVSKVLGRPVNKNTAKGKENKKTKRKAVTHK